jgi:D-sedoheptulose 7-phosphate isomerase
MSPPLAGRDHLAALAGPLAALAADAPRLHGWGERLAGALLGGGRLLAAGNGGSAAQAQHLCAELVGRYRDDRIPLAAIALTVDAPALTAIVNDYGGEAIFARQVRAHGRPGDVLVLLSTSGASPNVIAAAEAARACGMVVWALCGRTGTPLARVADDALVVDSPHTATVQEVHLVAVHLICAGAEAALAAEGVLVEDRGAGAGAGGAAGAGFGGAAGATGTAGA